MLRIVGGKYRRLLIEAPNTNTTRPTTDKVREALMSALGGALYDDIVLDLFAGSGALALESLSRGSKECYFCDNNKLALNTIKQNVEKIKVEEEVHMVYGKYMNCLERLKGVNLVFDIVYLDPPYALKKSYDEVVDYLFENNMLSENAIIVKEGDEPFKEDERFTHHKAYKYGIVNIMIERR